jgi:hypothetical protein
MASVGCDERVERAERVCELREREGWFDILINNAASPASGKPRPVADEQPGTSEPERVVQDERKV